MFNFIKNLINKVEPKRWISDLLLKQMFIVYPPDQFIIKVIMINCAYPVINLQQATGFETNVHHLEFYFIDKNGKVSDTPIAKYWLLGDEADEQILIGPRKRLNEKFCNRELYPDTEVYDESEVDDERNKVRELLKNVLGAPSDFMAEHDTYPVTIYHRWSRKKLIALLQLMSHGSVDSVIKFNLDAASYDQLRKFENEIQLADLTSNDFEEEIDD